MVPALERETRGVLDHRIEGNAAAQLLLDAAIDNGAYHLRTAFPHDDEKVEVGLALMIASHARPEGVDTLYPSLGSAAFEARSDRRADARHRLSCVCVQGRTPSGRIAAPDSLDQSAGRLWEEPRTMQLAELVGGGMLTPRIEVGGRYDGGDAETGAGLVVGGSLGYAVPA